jgi:uncharacterized membrane protein
LNIELTEEEREELTRRVLSDIRNQLGNTEIGERIDTDAMAGRIVADVERYYMLRVVNDKK